MGILLDQLRAKLKKKQDQNSAHAVKQFKRVPKKDITFLAANSSPEEITTYVNSRTQLLIDQCGGVDRFVDGDFSVKYVDKSNKNDYVKHTQFTLDDRFANTSGTTFDWEATSQTEINNLKEDIEEFDVKHYMIIIEYTQIVEIQ